jgi:hypothetical protein
MVCGVCTKYITAGAVSGIIILNNISLPLKKH